MGRVDNKVAFVWDAYPGEEVEIAVEKQKKNFIEGTAVKILKTSKLRTPPADEHYLSCSPWQTLDYEAENEWKKKIAEETYSRLAKIPELKLEMIAPKNPYGYRNKIEFSFTKNKKDELSLAFHDRGSHELRALDFCALSDARIQDAGRELIETYRKLKIPLEILKSLIVRSDESGVVAALFVNQRDFLRKFTLEKPESLKGLQVYYSNPLSPASVPTELLLSVGESHLEQTFNGVRLKFGLLSFFQINPGIFEETLKDIGNFVSAERVVDYYSGVGAIGLSLHGKYKEATLVEENAEAVDFALENVASNGFANVKVKKSLAEKAAPEISGEDVVIVDPPRTGLHVDVVKHLLKTLPKRIIYLSCGVDTHARDILFLGVRYKPVFWKLYNFFPRTPHIEALCVLERIV